MFAKIYNLLSGFTPNTNINTSQISNIINSVEHRRSRALSTVGDGADVAATTKAHQTVDTGKLVADQEWSEAFRAAAYQALKDDQIALDVLNALQEGWSRQESIELLGMSSDEFDAARKRMNRRIEQKCKRFYKEMVQ